jgi:transcriptional regulator with XRE-family HTH domain
MPSEKSQTDVAREFLESLLAGFNAIVDRSSGIRARDSTGSPKIQAEFCVALRLLLNCLGWEQKELVERTGISKSQVSAWLDPNVGRSVGPDDVCRMAAAFADGIDQRCKPLGRTPGRGHLDCLLFGLLVIAGFPPAARYENIVWREQFLVTDKPSQRPRIRIGWFPWVPLVKEGFTGIIRDITFRVFEMLGVEAKRLELVQVDFTDCDRLIQCRYLDLMSPMFMKFPGRTTRFHLSDVIPA